MVGLGVENLVVVETDDAVLIAERSQAQNVKAIVQQLEADGSSEGKAHRRIYRPWGHYTSIVEGSRWQEAHLGQAWCQPVAADASPPRRAWVVVRGTALVEKNGVEELIGETRAPTSPWGQHRSATPARSRWK